MRPRASDYSSVSSRTATFFFQAETIQAKSRMETHLGCAPFAFQRALRVEKARELLSNTELSIEAISRIVGIDSPTSSWRIFRRPTGQSPREYRLSNSVHARGGLL